MLARVSRACQARGLALQTYFCRDGERAGEALEQIQRGPERNVFAVHALRHDTGAVSRLDGARLPSWLDGIPPGYPGSTVVTDARAAVRVGLEHLLALGHERIVLLVNEPIRDTSVVDKVEEFQRAHGAYGLLSEPGRPLRHPPGRKLL